MKCHGRTSLHLAALNNRLDIVKCLKNAGANIHVKDNTGRTPLHMASVRVVPRIRAQDLEIVKYLVEAGATLEAKDNRGDTSLDIASRSWWLATVVRYLKEAAYQSPVQYLSDLYRIRWTEK